MHEPRNPPERMYSVYRIRFGKSSELEGIKKMNSKRRKSLSAIAKKLKELQGDFESIKENLETVRDEEQGALDNMPEGLQEGERGQQMQEYIDGLEDIMNDLDCMDIERMVDSLNEIVG